MRIPNMCSRLASPASAVAASPDGAATSAAGSFELPTGGSAKLHQLSHPVEVKHQLPQSPWNMWHNFTVAVERRCLVDLSLGDLHVEGKSRQEVGTGTLNLLWG